MDIKNIVMEDLKKVIDESILDTTVNNLHFSYGDGAYEPGTYIYEKNDVYHYVGVGDRGGVDDEIKTSNIEDILYKIYSTITFNEATKFAMVNREKNRDWRRILFKKQLELLRCIGEIYYQKRKEEIATILLTSPYKDNI
ncbi:MAG: hypothetical protein K2N15_04775, partial [Lachnospiraceae bacterium]|nr:hypothetical protein [Lachnospiraceae bacterium]